MKLTRKQRKNIKRKRDNMLKKIQDEIKSGFALDPYGLIRETKEICKRKLKENR